MNSSTNVRLLRRVLQHGRLLIVALVLTFLYAMVSGVSLGMILPFVDLLFSGGEPATPILPEAAGPIAHIRWEVQVWATEWFFAGGPQHALMRICVLLVSAFAAKGVVGYVLAVTTVRLEERVLKDLRDDLFVHLQGLSMGWFAGRRSGELLSRATNDVSVTRKAVTGLYRTVPRDVLLVIAYLTIVFVASWRLALLCCVVFPGLAVVIGVLGKRIRRQTTLTQAKMGDRTNIFQETIGGIRVVKAFGWERFAIARFAHSAEDYLRSIVRVRRLSAMASPMAELTGAIGAVIVLWVGGSQILAGTGLTPSWFVIFLAAMVSLMQPVRGLTQIHTHLAEGGAAAERIFEILETEPAIRNRAGAQEFRGLRERIRFENVSFEYDANAPVIRGVDLEIGRGEVVALVGPSGAGKSTLVDLLPRFQDPDTGRVTFDGIDLRDLNVESVRSRLGIVTQETILFHDTIRANIAFADPEPDEDRLVAAAIAANAHEFIVTAPDGYDTVIGDRGLRLSGGERQRLSIARAIYRNPEILIFDEATSALDSESEAKVQEAIDRLMEGRTAVVIAHRLSTVRNADRIAVLDQGQLVEFGDHESLLAERGLYARLCERQFREGPVSPQAPS